MKSAIYPGSFDPITFGHIDIVKRALKVFDHVYIGVLHNLDKTPLFSLEKRIEQIQTIFADEPKVSVEGFNGLLIDYAKQKEVHTIIRGLRALSDFDYEFQIALTNRKLDSDGDTIFFMTDEKHAYLSSSIVKQVAKYNGDISSFVPPLVLKDLRTYFAKETS